MSIDNHFKDVAEQTIKKTIHALYRDTNGFKLPPTIEQQTKINTLYIKADNFGIGEDLRNPKSRNYRLFNDYAEKYIRE